MTDNTYSDALSTVNNTDSADLDTVIAALATFETAVNTVMATRADLPDGPMTNAQLALISAKQNLDIVSTNLTSARANYPTA
jgi:hypothetical protein